jgi:hypothetical protein
MGRRLGEFEESGTKFFIITTSPTQHPTALITAPAEGWIPVDEEYVSKEFERELDSIIRRYKFLGLESWDIDEILIAKADEQFIEGL